MTRRMTTISITEETRGKLLVIRELLGIGASFNGALIEVLAVYQEHQSCERELEKVKQELVKCQEKW